MNTEVSAIHVYKIARSLQLRSDSKGSGYSRRSFRPDTVRYVSVTTAAHRPQWHVLIHGTTRREGPAGPPSRSQRAVAKGKPFMPSLRRARRDTSLPVAASLRRPSAWSIPNPTCVILKRRAGPDGDAVRHRDRPGRRLPGFPEPEREPPFIALFARTLTRTVGEPDRSNLVEPS